MRPASTLRSLLPATAAITVLAGGLFVFLSRSEALPDGPQAIVWDRTPCAHCRMAVSEPSFAAQLQLTDGRVLGFDDPGCLFRHLAGEETPIHAVYFHHLREDRWLSPEQVGFVTAGPSPMASNLGAVERAREGGLTFAEARGGAATPARADHRGRN